MGHRVTHSLQTPMTPIQKDNHKRAEQVLTEVTSDIDCVSYY